MKKTGIIILLVFGGTIVYSQTIVNDVIGSAGTQYVGNTHQLSWTVGETVIETVGNLTQGFHQNNLLVSSIEQIGVTVETKVYPNPFSSTINIEFTEYVRATVRVFDMLGKQILADDVSGTDHVLSVDQFVPGMYFIRIEYSTRATSVFQVIKR